MTSNLILPSTGRYGSTVSWSSSNGTIVSASGTVARPLNANESATLTATITKGTKSDTKEFVVTVLSRPATPQECVDSDLDGAIIGYAPGDDADHVTYKIVLPSTGPSGSSYSWVSSNTSAISDDGIVTRPASNLNDTIVSMTLTASNGGFSKTRIFILKVLKLAEKPVVQGLVSPGIAVREFTWSWIAPGAVEYRHSISTQSDLPEDYPSWSAWDNETTAATGTNDGVYYCRVQARTASGIVSDIAVATALVDRTPPNAPTVTVEPATLGTPRPSWVWTTAEDATGYRIGFKEGIWIREVTTNAYLPSVDLGYGTSTLYVQARDSAGNWSTSGSASSLRGSPANASLGLKWSADHLLGNPDGASRMAAVPGRFYSISNLSGGVLKFFDTTATTIVLKNSITVSTTAFDDMLAIAARGTKVANRRRKWHKVQIV